jgi:hypothetical protein
MIFLFVIFAGIVLISLSPNVEYKENGSFSQNIASKK